MQNLSYFHQNSLKIFLNLTDCWKKIRQLWVDFIMGWVQPFGGFWVINFYFDDILWSSYVFYKIILFDIKRAKINIFSAVYAFAFLDVSLWYTENPLSMTLNLYILWVNGGTGGYMINMFYRIFFYLISVSFFLTAPLDALNIEELKAHSKTPPKSLRPCAGDAYLLFQVRFQEKKPSKSFCTQRPSTGNAVICKYLHFQCFLLRWT